MNSATKIRNPIPAIAIFLLCFAAFANCQQGSIESPCNPYAPEDQPQCTVNSHLVCAPLWNHVDDGTCVCVPGSFWHGPWFDECRVGASLPCSTATGAVQCTPYSTCQATEGGGEEDATACACDEETYPQAVGSYCVTGYGRPCVDATGQLAQCDRSLGLECGGPDPVSRICSCSGSDVWSSTRGKCLVAVESSNSCSTNDDCVDNAVCSRNNFGIARCICAPGFSKNAESTCSLALGESCEPVATVTCNADEFLECSAANRTCACADGRFPLSGRCLGLADHDCENHGDCTGGTLCHQTVKKCFCSQAGQMIQLVDRTCGRLGRGGYCRLGGYEDCPATEYVRCFPIQGTTYGRCECEDGAVVEENGRCAWLAGTTCEAGNQNCVANAACLQGVCTCLPGSAQTTAGQCVKSVDQPCDNVNTDNQCNLEQGLSCVSSVCTCPVGQEWSEAHQHCVALTSGACSPTTNYCTANSTCNALGVCECVQGYAQDSPEGRHCAPSHGAVCDPTTAPCNENQFLTCSMPDWRCACEFPLYQNWDASRAQCVSVLGGPCGPLEEHVGRELQCIETSVCKTGVDLVPKCVCDEENGREPDGQGKCHDPTITTTTSTTTTTPPTTPPTTTTEHDHGNGDNGSQAVGGAGQAFVIALSAITVVHARWV